MNVYAVNVEHDVTMTVQQQVLIDAQEFFEWCGTRIHEATKELVMEYLNSGVELDGFENPRIT